MNIQTVAENLRNTIAGKEMLLASYQGPMDNCTEFVKKTTIHFLEINIAELERVLQDVEQCIDEMKV